MSFIIEDRFLKELHLKGNELLLYAYIYSYSRGMGGGCFQCHQTIANNLGMTRRTIINTFDSLIKKGYIGKRPFCDQTTNMRHILYYVNEIKNDYSIVKYQDYILKEFSSVSKDLYFRDANWVYTDNQVCLVIHKELPEQWLTMIDRQNKFWNLQHKTYYQLKVLVEK